MQKSISMSVGEAEEERDEEDRSKLTKMEKRIVELKDVEDNIAILLNLAGCTVASLHPDPLATFSDSIVSLDDDSPDSDDEADGDQKMSEGARRPAIPTQELGKEEQFAKYAEAYYSTLFDIQRALRTSIRHLRLSHASPAPLLDPSFASLSSFGAQVGTGGVASADLLKQMPLRGESAGTEDGVGEKKTRKSVSALRLEKEAIQDLLAATRQRS